MKKEKKRFPLILSIEQYNRLKLESEATLLSMTAIAREALDKLFKEKDKEAKDEIKQT